MAEKLGKFIVFEGIDGSGKSTQVKMLQRRFRREKRRGIVFTREHTLTGPAGSLIEEIVTKKETLPPKALQLLFVADRIDHLEKEVIPTLEKGKHIISDRYFWSTVAYGSLTANVNWLWQLNRYCRQPDWVILVDVPAKLAVKRMEKGRKKDSTIFEKEKKLRRIRRAYLKIARAYPKTTFLVDGRRQPEQIHEEIYNWITKRI